MKKGLFIVVMLGMVMALGMIITSCDLLAGCKDGIDCRVMTNQYADGAYEVCSDSSCAAYNVPYPVPKNTNVKCDC
jgi:hypothetical protein